MARLSNIQQYEQRIAAAPPVGITPQSQSVREGFQQMGKMNPQQPTLQKVDPNMIYQSTRSQALGHESNQADPQKAMEYFNASPYEYWTEQVKANPNSTYAIVNQMFASNETPEEKRKRERREALGETFRGLGNLIGHAANLYYTHRGGQYIDLNTANERHRARMERLKEKQDALDEQRRKIIINAKLGDIKTQQAERAAERKAERDAAADALKNKREMAKLAIQHAYNLGEIDAKTAAELAKNADNAKSDKELETLKQKNRVALKATPSYGENKVVDSAIGADGNIYTRNSKLTDNEAMQIVQSSVPADELAPFVTTDEDGNQKTDWRAAAAYALQKGYIGVYELEQMGFRKGKSSKKKGNSLGLGIGSNNNNGNKLGIGL